MVNGKLERLKRKRQELEAQIRQEEAREKTRTRKQDTRRKILAGAAVLDQAGKDPKYKQQLYGLIDRFYTRADDRALFGLPPLPQNDNQAPENIISPEEEDGR